MNFFSKLKDYGKNVLGGAQIVGGAIKNALPGGNSQNANAYSALQRQSYQPPTPPAPKNASSGQGILKPGGWETLNNAPTFQAPTQKPGIVPQVYSSSLGGPMPSASSGGQKDYTQPSSQYVPPVSSGSGYAPPANSNSSGGGSANPPPAQPTGGIRDAYAALKKSLGGIAGNVGNFYLDAINTRMSQDPLSNIAGSQVGLAVTPTPPPTTPTPPPTTTPTLPSDATVTATTAPPSAVKGPGDLKSQYETITQDKTSDSTTLRNNLSQTKALEDQQKQAQIQSIKARIAELTSQRDQMIAAGEQAPPVDPNQLDQFGLDTPYAPDAQPAISQVSAQLQALEAELASAMGDSPEYQAANEALNAKIAEEAAINARLRKGQENIAEQPVAYSFISGQQAALQRQAGADLETVAAQQIPLQQRLATEQAKKQSAIDVVKTKYGFLGDERDRLVDTYKTNYARSTQLADDERAQQRKLELEAAKPKSTNSSSSGNISSSNVTALKNALKQSSFEGPEADGKYANPQLYLDNYNSYPDKAEFLRLFPPATYINPANTWLPAEIMQFVKQESRSV